ncbi:hypothetical protein VP236O401_P0048 [Vibrio phage 236O40-1]|nr:hypothetical protein VP236O401_P0048 [Vibrio phage 236O40-1]
MAWKAQGYNNVTCLPVGLCEVEADTVERLLEILDCEVLIDSGYFLLIGNSKDRYLVYEQ